MAADEDQPDDRRLYRRQQRGEGVHEDMEPSRTEIHVRSHSLNLALSPFISLFISLYLSLSLFLFILIFLYLSLLSFFISLYLSLSLYLSIYLCRFVGDCQMPQALKLFIEERGQLPLSLFISLSLLISLSQSLILSISLGLWGTVRCPRPWSFL